MTRTTRRLQQLGAVCCVFGMLAGCAAVGAEELARQHSSGEVVTSGPVELPSTVVPTPAGGGTRSVGSGSLGRASPATTDAPTVGPALTAANEAIVATTTPPTASSDTAVANTAPPTEPTDTVVATAPRAAPTEAVAAPAPAPAPAPPNIRSGADVSIDQAVGDPLTISIPAIRVSSDLVPVGVLSDGTVAVPEDPSIAGWFTGGPRPGERGPAIIMGHVDSREFGPGVFWDLIRLPVGSVVTITSMAGTTDFVVDAVERFPKDQFPTERIYGPVPRAALRLVTCGGSFDRSSGHYRDNVVAFLSALPV